MNQGGTIKFYGRTCVAVVILVAFLGLGPLAPQAQAWKHEGPGLYGGVAYECHQIPCYGIKKLKGFVGLPVKWAAIAYCSGGKWDMRRVEVVTGALPPGLRIGGKYNARIVGVPKRAGTWYLQVRFVGVKCAGQSYGNITQKLAITTTGSTAPRSLR